MRNVQTVTDDKVRESLLHGEGNVESIGGWCVFVDKKGQRFYVFDDKSRPVPLTQFLPSSPGIELEDPRHGFIN